MDSPSSAPAPAPAPAKGFTFRRCIALCVPALILGLVLRILFMISIPEGYFGSDSNSYYETAAKLFTKGEWKMGAKRAGSYPPFLVASTVLPGSTVQTVAVIQHFTGLLTLVALGWVVGHCTRRPNFWVPIVTLFYALLPSVLWFEHEVMADAFLVQFFILAVAVAVPTQRLDRPWMLFWYLICAAVIVSLKPHGRPIWAGLVVAAFFIRPNVLRWGWQNIAAVILGIVLILTTGSSKQGSWLLLSSVLPLVDLEGEKYAEYRKDLSNVVLETRQNVEQYPWKQGFYKKVINDSDQAEWQGKGWLGLLDDSQQFSKVAKHLAVEGILKNPVMFSKFLLKKFAIAMSKVAPDVKTDPKEFWRMQEGHNKARWKKKPKEGELLYDVDAAGYKAMVQDRLGRPAYLHREKFEFTKVVNWFVQIEPPASEKVLVPSATPSPVGDGAAAPELWLAQAAPAPAPAPETTPAPATTPAGPSAPEAAPVTATPTPAPATPAPATPAPATPVPATPVPAKPAPVAAPVAATPAPKSAGKPKTEKVAKESDDDDENEPAAKTLPQAWPKSFNKLQPTWMFWLGMLGILHCLLPGMFKRGVLLLIPTAMYMIMIYTVGDSRPRYLMPLEWVLLLLGVLGAELILNVLTAPFRKKKSEQPAA